MQQFLSIFCNRIIWKHRNEYKYIALNNECYNKFMHILFCFPSGDRNLMQEIVFDAKVTEWFSRNVSFIPKDDKG